MQVIDEQLLAYAMAQAEFMKRCLKEGLKLPAFFITTTAAGELSAIWLHATHRVNLGTMNAADWSEPMKPPVTMTVIDADGKCRSESFGVEPQPEVKGR